MKSKIDFVYVINLNTSMDEIKDRLKKVYWKQNIPYYIMPAINGWEAKQDYWKPADWWKIDSDNNWWNRDVKPGECGVCLSHLKAIKAAYDADFEQVLILEEDFNPSGDFPNPNMFLEVPNDCSILFLDRNPLWPDKEKKIGTHTTEALYSYNAHSYIITRKGMEEILSSNIYQNVITFDEALPAFNGTSDRQDAVDILGIDGFKQYAFDYGYFTQLSDKNTSQTENNPKITNMAPNKDKKPKYTIPNIPESKDKVEVVTFEDVNDKKWNILDTDDWDGWCKRYIHPLVLNKEYDLAIDEPAPHVYTFPLFTKEFCNELIELSETKEWTNDRHEFYPTTDNLLEVLGMDKIYNRLINDHIKPLAINRFWLEGKSWDYLADESFVIRYKPEEQAHLSLHHDYSSFTTLVNLNSGEFKGGGTYFPKYKCLVNPKEVGMCTLHPGNITHKHGARPVTEGTRYVVVSFIKNKDLQ